MLNVAGVDWGGRVVLGGGPLRGPHPNGFRNWIKITVSIYYISSESAVHKFRFREISNISTQYI